MHSLTRRIPKRQSVPSSMILLGNVATLAQLFLLTTIVLLARQLPLASAEAYNIYNYDGTNPQFTPDGRLLQLEYARLASDHSAPIFLLPLTEPNHAAVSESFSSSSLVALLTYRPASRLQERLLVYQNSKPGSPSVVLGLAGVVADCGALNRQVQKGSMDHFRMHGDYFSSAREWALFASQCCQVRMFGGGIRPYGATMMVMEAPVGSKGTNKDPPNNVFIADPTGTIQTLCSDSIKVPTSLIGGGFSRESKLRQDLANTWPLVLDQHKDSLADQLARAMEMVQNAVQESATEEESKMRDDSTTATELAFEVVLVSSERGIFKLTPAQIQAIQSRRVLEQ